MQTVWDRWDAFGRDSAQRRDSCVDRAGEAIDSALQPSGDDAGESAHANPVPRLASGRGAAEGGVRGSTQYNHLLCQPTRLQQMFSWIEINKTASDTFGVS